MNRIIKAMQKCGILSSDFDISWGHAGTKADAQKRVVWGKLEALFANPHDTHFLDILAAFPMKLTPKAESMARPKKVTPSVLLSDAQIIHITSPPSAGGEKGPRLPLRARQERVSRQTGSQPALSSSPTANFATSISRHSKTWVLIAGQQCLLTGRLRQLMPRKLWFSTPQTSCSQACTIRKGVTQSFSSFPRKTRRSETPLT